MLDCEDLKEVTLIGHSYGGMVATGVADKVRRRIARIVYLDAFAPQDGQSLFDLLGPQAAENMRGKAMGEGAGDTFRQFSELAKGDSSWKYYEMDASHNPHITCPQDLMATLTKIMAET